MAKIRDCNHCLFYSHALLFVCQLHPKGVDCDRCLDFRPHPKLHPPGAFYDGDFLRIPHLTPEQRFQLQLIKSSRLVGGCPRCGGHFSPMILCCPRCGFTDA